MGLGALTEKVDVTFTMTRNRMRTRKAKNTVAFLDVIMDAAK